jgi:zinc protease
LSISALPTDGVSLQDAEKAIQSEIDLLKTELIQAEEG